jgi:hypothetical protein
MFFIYFIFYCFITTNYIIFSQDNITKGFYGGGIHDSFSEERFTALMNAKIEKIILGARDNIDISCNNLTVDNTIFCGGRLVSSGDQTFSGNFQLTGNNITKGNLFISDGQSIVLGVGAVSQSHETLNNYIYFSTPQSIKNQDGTYTAGIYINPSSLSSLSLDNNKNSPNLNVLMIDPATGIITKKNCSGVVFQNYASSLTPPTLTVESNNSSSIISGDSHYIRMKKTSDRSFVNVSGSANQCLVGDIDNNTTSGFSSFIQVTGIGNTVGNSIRIIKPEQSDWRSYPSGQCTMSFVCGQSNLINFEDESTRPVNPVQNININSAMFVAGQAIHVSNYGSKINNLEGKNAVIIAGGEFYNVKNSGQNNLVIITGDGIDNDNRFNFATSFDKSLYLSAGKNGNIVLNPESIPMYDRFDLIGASEDYVLCFKNSSVDGTDNYLDGRITKKKLSDFSLVRNGNFLEDIDYEYRNKIDFLLNQIKIIEQNYSDKFLKLEQEIQILKNSKK